MTGSVHTRHNMSRMLGMMVLFANVKAWQVFLVELKMKISICIATDEVLQVMKELVSHHHNIQLLRVW